MDIVKIFASALTIGGMLLLIYTCFIFMRGDNAGMTAGGLIAPVILGSIFFGAGLFLFKYMVTGTRSSSNYRRNNPEN